VAVLADYPGRPGAGAGQNWLLTGSDSRQGLATRQEKQLSTGRDVTGQRSDTIGAELIRGHGRLAGARQVTVETSGGETTVWPPGRPW